MPDEPGDPALLPVTTAFGSGRTCRTLTGDLTHQHAYRERPLNSVVRTVALVVGAVVMLVAPLGVMQVLRGPDDPRVSVG
ncbi:hypothetical protein ACFQ07_09300, partial [Actinomadura adrarensis]